MDWPKNRKPIEIIENLEPFPEKESIYPYRKWIECNDNIDVEFKNRVEYILKLFYSLPDSNQFELLDPIFAYYAGKEIQLKQPTLATVSFISALSPLSDVKQCDGKVICTECGDLKYPNGSNFRHFLNGARASLFHSLCNLIDIEEGSTNYKELDMLLKNIYNKHRSAFVHGATFRHGEYYKDYNLPAALPTENLPFSELMIYKSDLNSFEPIVRRALLELIAKKTKKSLNYEILNLDEFSIKIGPAFEMSISIPAKTIVGLKLGPDENNKIED